MDAIGITSFKSVREHLHAGGIHVNGSQTPANSKALLIFGAAVQAPKTANKSTTLNLFNPIIDDY